MYTINIYKEVSKITVTYNLQDISYICTLKKKYMVYYKYYFNIEIS